MRWVRLSLMLASLGFLHAGGVRGQGRAIPGDRVRLEVYGSTQITPMTPTVLWTGRLVGVDDGELRLVGLAGDSVRLAPERIRSIQVWSLREGRKRGRGFGIGALVGGLLGAAAASYASGMCESECGGVVSFALTGLIVGAVPGGILGLLFAPKGPRDVWHDAALPEPLGPRAAIVSGRVSALGPIRELGR